MLKHPNHQVLPYGVVHATTRARARWTLVPVLLLAVVVNSSRGRDRAPVGGDGGLVLSRHAPRTRGDVVVFHRRRGHGDAPDRPARGVRVRGDARDGRAERGGGGGGAATGDSRGVSDATRRDARERRVYEQRARGRARERGGGGVLITIVEQQHDQQKARARPTTTNSTRRPRPTRPTRERSRPLDRRARCTRVRSHHTHNCDDASHAHRDLYENTRTSCRTTASRARNYGRKSKLSWPSGKASPS